LKIAENNFSNHAYKAKKEQIMANNVTAQVLGGQAQIKTASKVSDLATSLDLGDNHSVKINGVSATYDTELKDYDFVSFGEKVKGGTKPKTILIKAKDRK